MRELHSHKTNGLNDAILIGVADEPGQGDANHAYRIAGCDFCANPSYHTPRDNEGLILFQNGPLKETCPNGLTNEVLLAILIDRLQSFQAGAYACYENSMALNHIERALVWLKDRTAARIERGVEGTNVA